MTLKNTLLTVAAVSAASLVLVGCAPQADEAKTPPGTEAVVELPEGALIQEGVLQVAISQSPPYVQQSETGDWVGVDVDLMNAVGDLLGVEVKFIDSQFDALIPGLKANRFDMATGVGDFVERQAETEFIDYAQSQLTVAVNANGDYQPEQLLDLCDATIGFETGTAGGTMLSEQLPALCAEAGKTFVGWQGFADRTQLQLALQSNRIEGLAAPVASNDLTAAASDGEIVNLIIEDINTIPGVVAIYGFVFQKDSVLVDPILEAVQLLEADGRYQEIFAEWDIPNSVLPADQILHNGSTLTRS